MVQKRYSVVIDIRVSGAGKAKSNVKGVGDSAREAAGGVDVLKGAWTAFAGVLAAVGAGQAIGFLKRLGAEAVQLATVQQRAEAQVAAAIKSTAEAAGISARELRALASAQQGVTTVGDELILSMQAVLLTFTKISGDVFPRASQVILDMSARLGTDLKSAALQVGKALQDPIQGISSLREAGVQLSKQQQQQIRDFVAMGDVASAQKIILSELEAQFGGAAAAMREDFGGATDALRNTWGDLLEELGRTASALTPGIEGVNDFLQTLISGFQVLKANALPVIADIVNHFQTFFLQANRGAGILRALGFDELADSLVDVDVAIGQMAEGLRTEAAEAGQRVVETVLAGVTTIEGPGRQAVEAWAGDWRRLGLVISETGDQVEKVTSFQTIDTSEGQFTAALRQWREELIGGAEELQVVMGPGGPVVKAMSEGVTVWEKDLEDVINTSGQKIQKTWGAVFEQLVAFLANQLGAVLFSASSELSRSNRAGLTLTRDSEAEAGELGEAIGAIIGSYFGPAGAAIGGLLGEAIARAINDPSRPFINFDIAIEQGEFALANLETHKRDADQVRDIGEQITGALNELFETLGASLVSIDNLNFFEQNGKIQIRSNEVILHIAETVEEAIAFMFLQGVQMAEVTGVPPETLEALRKAAADAGGDLEKFREQLDLVDQLTRLQYNGALMDTIRHYDELIEASRLYGIGQGEITNEFLAALGEFREEALLTVEARDRYNATVEHFLGLEEERKRALEEEIARLEHMLDFGGRAEWAAARIADLRAELDALGTTSDILRDTLIGPDEPIGAGTPTGGGRGGGRRAARARLHEELQGIVDGTMSDIEILHAEYAAKVAEIREEVSRLKGDADLAEAAIAALGDQLERSLKQRGEDLVRSLSPLANTIFSALDVGAQVRELVNNFEAFGLTAKQVDNVLADLAGTELLAIETALAQIIGDEELIAELQRETQAMEIAHLEFRALMLFREGIITAEQLARIEELARRAEEAIREVYETIDDPPDPTDPNPDNRTFVWRYDANGCAWRVWSDGWHELVWCPDEGGGPPDDAQNALDDALRRLEDYEDLALSPFQRALKALNEDFAELRDILGDTERVQNAYNIALQDLLDQYLRPLVEFTDGLLSSQFSPLKLQDQQALVKQRFLDAITDLPETGDIGLVTSLAQELLGLAGQVFPAGSEGYRLLFEWVMNQLEQAQEIFDADGGGGGDGDGLIDGLGGGGGNGDGVQTGFDRTGAGKSRKSEMRLMQRLLEVNELQLLELRRMNGLSAHGGPDGIGIRGVK